MSNALIMCATCGGGKKIRDIGSIFIECPKCRGLGKVESVESNVIFYKDTDPSTPKPIYKSTTDPLINIDDLTEVTEKKQRGRPRKTDVHVGD